MITIKESNIRYPNYSEQTSSRFDALGHQVFIDIRDFDSYDKVIDFIVDLSPEEIDGYKERIKTYITSEQSNDFSSVTYAKKLIEIIEGGEKINDKK